MLYREVLLYFLCPPIVLLGAVYWPLLGRRDVLKILWLCLMATVWTTPWDNWIISQSGWTYPAGSILGAIFLIPIEEHLFFILQPIFLVLLHCVGTHYKLLPFSVDLRTLRLESGSSLSVSDTPRKSRSSARRLVRTLKRRRFEAFIWLVVFLVGVALLSKVYEIAFIVNEVEYKLKSTSHAFYLGWILVWISPVIGFLTRLGGKLERADWAVWAIGSSYLCIVDSIAIRSGAWSISEETSFGWNVIPGLPVEEMIFFMLTSYLIVLSCSLISHLHTLMLLSPFTPPCPPTNPLFHIYMLAEVALAPPPVDYNVLNGLVTAEQILAEGSKSFSVAKLAFTREMRIGLIAMYSWCRVTDNLVDDPIQTRSPSRTSETGLKQGKEDTVASIRSYLLAVYSSTLPSNSNIYDGILDTIPNLDATARSAFRLFAAVVPRLVPLEPFLELCDGYETDLKFTSITTTSDSTQMASPARASALSLQTPSTSTTPTRSLQKRRSISRSPSQTLKARAYYESSFELDDHLPIKTHKDLLEYADNVAGSIAAAICYLAWSILEPPHNLYYAYEPVKEMVHLAKRSESNEEAQSTDEGKRKVLEKAREMGRGLQLVNISRDIAKDALHGRVYFPLSSFSSAKALLAILFPSASDRPSYAPFTLPLLGMADEMRLASIFAIESLPRIARGGIRAMVASYFEIGSAVRRNGGEVDEKGIKVNKWVRIRSAARAMWLGTLFWMQWP